MRQSFQRPAAALASAMLLAATLAGCASAPKPGSGTPSVDHTSHPGHDGVDPSKLSKELYVFNWTEYLPESVLKEFEQQYGVKVKYDTYSSNEEMHAKLKAGGGGYDLVFPSDWMAGLLNRDGLAEKIDFANVPNMKNIDAKFKGLPHDPKNEFSVPYMWGTTGIIINTDKVKPESVTGYKDLWKPEFKGNLVMPDDAREVIGAALRSLGKTLNEKDPQVLAQAKQKVLDLKPNIKVYNSDSPKDLLLGGEVVAGVVWSGEAAQVLRQSKNFKYILPEEGVTIWVDHMVIPKGAAHKYTAEVFMNFLLDPQISKQLSEAFPYGNPNQEARKLLPEEFHTNPAIEPPAEGLKKAQYVEDLGDTVNQVYDQMWTEIKG
ncbi:MAG: spermidine/putrescine transporter spermidine/putrescine-binding protein [Firmicutes bacterium]|nr:spermidine/putrescine transporter spermidine/putrescine-binding protein [Bacillota bacterium]